MSIQFMFGNCVRDKWIFTYVKTFRLNEKYFFFPQLLCLRLESHFQGATIVSLKKKNQG